MAENKPRLYKYDNVKALLIFLVVVGHLTTDYVSDAHAVRWFTLWIYTFHMPAFVFVSGLLHSRYITKSQAELGIKGKTSIRWDKVLGFLFCAYGLKIFLQLFRTAIGQHPTWHWIDEPGIPWYLIVMAEYEILLFVLRRVNWKPVLAGSFILSAVIGYFPSVGDTLCLARMINFFPIFFLGYCAGKEKIIEFTEKKKIKTVSWIIVIASLVICYVGPWKMYSIRKWFTGRRSYEFLSDYFGNIMPYAWLIRLGIWTVAIILTLAIIAVVPNRNMGYISTIGANSLNVYFWHRPICYWINKLGLFPWLVKFAGGNYDIALMLFVLVGLGMTLLFALRVFEHPAKELTLSGKLLIKKD